MEKRIKKTIQVPSKKRAMVKVIYVHTKESNDKTMKKKIPVNGEQDEIHLNEQPWIKPRKNKKIEKLRNFILRNIKVDDYGISYTHHDRIIDWESFLKEEKIKLNKRMNMRRVKHVTIEDFEMLETLGKGAFGEVKLTLLKKIDTYLAAKVVKREGLKGKGMNQFVREKNILKGIFFPFAVHLAFFIEDLTNLYLILPLLLGGDLFSHLRKNDKLPETAAVFYSAQVVLTLEYLHNFNILYRDLKPENILMDHCGYLKLSDFGLSKIVEIRTYTLTGTADYLAPEVIENKGYGVSADWWSFGVLIYELCCGYAPFSSDNESLTFSRIVKGLYNLPSNLSEDLCDLISNLLVLDVTKRFGSMKNGVNDIKSHRWFNSINWLSLVNRQLIPPYKPELNSAYDTRYFQDQVEEMKQTYNF